MDDALEDHIGKALKALLGRREGANVSRILLDHAAGLHPADRQEWLESAVERLEQGEPVQYITGNTWFFGRSFIVTPDTLIPRPETEELVDWVVRDLWHVGLGSPVMIDIGTGCGCIAVTLKHELAHARVEAVDISSGALRVARHNAQLHDVQVHFHQCDFLEEGLQTGRQYNCIVSNPPYVSTSEFEALEKTVRDFEPLHALKPVGSDGLIFYKHLARSGHRDLLTNGVIFVELNAMRVDEIEQIFREAGYETKRRRDMQGQWRMLKAWL